MGSNGLWLGWLAGPVFPERGLSGFSNLWFPVGSPEVPICITQFILKSSLAKLLFFFTSPFLESLGTSGIFLSDSL